MDYDVVKNEEMYTGKILKIFKDQIVMPGGSTATREVVVKNNASAIVPIDDEGNIIFVRQYRHPAKDMVLEIPAGTFEEGEDPYECAIRELEEETGYKAEGLTYVNWSYASVGVCTERIYLYIAEKLNEGVQHLDEDEFVEIERYSLEDALAMIFDGTITDSKTMLGIFAYKELVTKRS
ncbi:ADP-ribose pyrophosphatase [bioreactor metagenome]|uniref:ADP-ribose pyrophosphatase n=1 Tax=bioreactor metagenome TaxID=1076179 RepID=A0A644Z2S6_9ZZZZ|nr:NUDIX hydrolase [Candidatus Metalachnospira sp.]